MNFLSLEEIYQEIIISGDCVTEVRLLLELRNWLNGVCEFDPRSGQPSPLGKSTLTKQIVKQWSVKNEDPLKDRLSRIIEHSKESVKSIINRPRQKVLREHSILPVYAVHEVDSSSMHWLSRKSGRNIREKLAGKPYLKAVHRHLSVDTTENRLFKDFSLKLERYLIERVDALDIGYDQSEYELLGSIKKWLKSDDAAEIQLWSNLPPNNSLLQDRSYRKIWDAWLWLQRLDEDLQNDQKRLLSDWQTVLFWTIISKLKQMNQIRFVEQPIFFDYGNFQIEPQIETKGIIYSKKDSKQIQSISCSIKRDKIVLKNGKKVISIVSKWNDQNRKITISIDGQLKEYKPSISEMKEISEHAISGLFNIDYNALEIDQKPDSITQSEDLSDIVIDIFNVRPDYNSGNGDHKVPFLLLQQLWEAKNKEIVPLDLGNSDAIAFRPNTKTISMVNIFSTDDNIIKSDIREAAMVFSAKLCEYFDKNRLFTYLVPDAFDEFSLVNIRKSLNFYFNNAQPLPRSIASVFTWHSSKEFKSTFKDGDCVLVIDSLTRSISLTPLVGRKIRNLSDKLPKSKGFIWERHPTIILEINRPFETLKEFFENDGCGYAENIIDIFGLDGIIELKDEISFVDEHSKWYTQPSSPRINFDGEIFWEKINKSVQHLDIKSIYYITLGEYASSINIKNIPEDVKIIELPKSLVFGGQVLNQWQAKVKDTPLWRDHLPELSIKVLKDGFYQNFSLVKDAAITPQKGKKVLIPIKQLFTLPKGQTFYQFPLTQGSEGNELEYMAYLKSLEFPLEEDMKCELILSYTYGDDDPYELQFIPRQRQAGGLQSVKAEWRKLSEIKYGELLYPIFPPRYDWKDFKEYPHKNKPNEFHDLFEWIESEFDKLNDIFTYISSNEDRKNGNIANIRYMEAGFCFVRVSDTDQKIFCHVNDFIIYPNNFDDLHIDQVLSFVIEETDKGPAAKRVVLESGLPSDSHNKFKKSLRFPMFTVWNSGHSLTENDVPKDFKKVMLKGISNCCAFLENEEEITQSLKGLENEVFFLLCILHKDMPPELSKELVEYSGSKIGYNFYYFKNMAYAIGDASLAWQKKILSNAIKHLESNWRASLILAIALWRVEKIIYTLKIDEITMISESLIKIIRKEAKGIKRSMKAFSKECLALELELLLALLRTRASNDEKIKMILSPDQELTKKFIKIIDEITNKIMKNDIELHSRIALQLEKPNVFKKIPDLLYALKMYLTCDSGANTIQITGVTDK